MSTATERWETRSASFTAADERSAAEWPASVQALPACFEWTCDRSPGRVAVEVEGVPLTYAELDRRANRLAHLLRGRGIREGMRVGILLGRSEQTYIAILGVLKTGAAYVPLDPSFPPDRLTYIVKDAEVCDLVTTSVTRAVTSDLPCAVLDLDEAAADLAEQPARRPDVDIAPSSLSYVIYTSGSTGKPKGVAISHASIVNFLRVTRTIYGVTAEDRVYQGMSISFDFHLEEIWPAWVAGATLVAGPNDTRRFGQGLADFLVENDVTFFCSVPTLLTTIENVPACVRCLLVSGEPMPEDLVRRWWGPDRRILNCYGPTETTVSSSCAQLLPDRPVTLGIPFSTYTFYVLDEKLRPVPDGEPGEISIGGPGTGVGYLNRPELTAERFIPNPIESERAAVPRVYRTGDLGRRLPSGEFEYLGRMDTQVKIRGYRIELGEIEQIIREDNAVENAVLTTLERDGVVTDLVGYVTLNEGTADDDAALREGLHAMLRRRLPPYMIPSYIEVLDSFPLLAADKVNRAALPPPTSPPLGSRAGEVVAAATPLEAQIGSGVQEVLGLPEVSVEADFFCDLGGHSLTAARLISRLRTDPSTATLSMGDLYANPTVRSLAAFVGTTHVAPSDAGTSEYRESLRHSSARVWACGLAQLLLDLVWLLVWSGPALGLLYLVLLFDLNLNIPVVGVPPAVIAILTHPTPFQSAIIVTCWVLWVLASLFLVPVVVSRTVMRRIRPGWYPLWGLTFIRFWFYGRVTALAALAVLSGTPFEAPYLRLLGARIGRQCQIATATIGLPMFVELGDGVSINYGAIVQPFVLEGGWLRIAPVRMGAHSFLGSGSLVMAGADIGEGAMVGDKSLVHADARIPAGEHWAGSPISRQSSVPPLLADMADRADSRRWTVPVVAGYLAGIALLILMPLVVLTPSTSLVVLVTLEYGLLWGVASVVPAAVLYVVVTCALLIVVKRVVLPRARPGIYPARGWFGVREWLSKNIVNQTIVLVRTIYCTLYVVPLLRGLGMRFGRWCEIAVPAFIDPDTTVTGDQTFLAAAITISPPVYHRGCIAVNPAEMGRRSFLGNVALLPGASRISENSLVGVHSVAPGRAEPETTWLGSPAIFLPRRQESEKFPDRLVYTPTRGMVAARLALEVFRVVLPQVILGICALVSVCATIVLARVYPPQVLVGILPAMWLAPAVAAMLAVALVKWLVVGRYRPRVEPYWGTWVRGTELVTGLFEVAAAPLVTLLAGTPFLPPFLRLLGMDVGRRVYITTSGGTEFDLIHIGDDATIADGAITQTHLFEDRVMKMSHVRVENGATVGPSAIVLYDGAVGAGASLDALSLAMKSEALPADTRWRGIPARPI